MLGKWLPTLLLAFLMVYPAWAGESSETLTHDGLERTYRLYVPGSYDGSTPVPLVIALHPSGGDGAIMAGITGFDNLAEGESFIVAYPEGPYQYWDYGAVAATISDDITDACSADNSVSVIYLHGTHDSVIPWKGKPLYMPNGTFIATALSAYDTAVFWATHDECNPQPLLSQNDADPNDNRSVQRAEFSDCIGGRRYGGDVLWVHGRRAYLDIGQQY